MSPEQLEARRRLALREILRRLARPRAEHERARRLFIPPIRPFGDGRRRNRRRPVDAFTAEPCAEFDL